MSPPHEQQQEGNAPHERLPQLHPDRHAIQVDLPASSTESEKLLITEDVEKADDKPAQVETPAEKLSSAQGNAAAEGFSYLLGTSIISALVLVGRVGVANRWAALMEASGFVDWPVVTATRNKIIVATIPLVGFGLLWVVMLVMACMRSSAIGLVRALSKVYLLTAVAFLIGNFYLFVNVWSHPISSGMAVSLAKQTAASASFNQGYCHAWCRQSATGLAAFLRGQCGSDTVPAFTEIAGSFDVGDWCKEAIASQNFDTAAEYSGISPLASLSGEGRAAVTKAIASDMLSVLSGLAGVRLLARWMLLEITLRDGARKPTPRYRFINAHE